MITHSVSLASNLGPGGAQIGGSASETGTVEHIIDESFTASTTDAPITIAFAYADVQAVYLLASSNTTLETNSGGPGGIGNTINLKAGIPFSWTTTCAYFANPFTVDVTAFYFTCTLASQVKGVILTA